MIYITLLIALIFRLVSINQSLWLDEATTALVSRMSLTDFFTKFIVADFHPPLYYLILHFWTNIFGYGEVSLRIPSVIFGIATVYCVYLIGKEIKLKNQFIASLFLATSGLHIYYSQEARMYSMAAFLVSLVVLTYIKKNWLLLSILLPLLFLTDYLSILVLPSILIYSLLNRKDLSRIVISCIPLSLAFVGWLPIFYRQLSQGLQVKESSIAWWGVLGTVNVKNILLIPAKFVIGRVSMDDKLSYALVVGLLTCIFIYILFNSKNKLLLSWLGVSLVLGILVSIFIPTLTYFRYLFVLPAFYLLISDGIDRLSMKYSSVAIGLVLFANIFTSVAYLTNSKFHRENWRRVVQEIGDESVVFPANSQKEALSYYGKSDQVISKEEITPKHNSLWLSRYVWNIFDPADSTRLYIEGLGYNKVSEINYNGVVFFKYENSN